MDTILNAYRNSDAVGKVIVDVLIIGSAWIWSIIISKCVFCRSIRKACGQVLRQMSGMGSTPHLILGKLQSDPTLEGPLASLGRTATKALLEILRPTPQQRIALLANGMLPRSLTMEEVDRIQVAMEAEINTQQEEMERKLPVMGSIITIAPMLGLFGTVWGVMATFVAIVQNGGRPDIQAIAPGISGALLTTVGGLVVAVPAIGANNLVVASIQATDREMEDFVSTILASLRLAPVASQQSAPVPPAFQAPAPPQNAYPAAMQQATYPPAPAQPAYSSAPAQQPAPAYPGTPAAAPAYQPAATSVSSQPATSAYPSMNAQTQPVAPAYRDSPSETILSVTTSRDPGQGPQDYAR
ncbi:MAG: MotA/TolQ/ExbB proton channel family protein [Lentisphaeria bacterium]|nr:MotA/TolQ/ExbB proton channel family protein [Lentisphaeria bacterium]